MLLPALVSRQYCTLPQQDGSFGKETGLRHQDQLLLAQLCSERERRQCIHEMYVPRPISDSFRETHMQICVNNLKSFSTNTLNEAGLSTVIQLLLSILRQRRIPSDQVGRLLFLLRDAADRFVKFVMAFFVMHSKEPNSYEVSFS